MREDTSKKYAGIPTYKIGEVSGRVGVQKTTIRYYEKRELIPKPDRRRSGYRIYTKRHINQLKFIKRAKRLGFTLNEVKELLELRVDEESSCSEIKEEAQTKYQDVKTKIEDLQSIKNSLIRLIDSCSGSGPKEGCPILKALEGDHK